MSLYGGNSSTSSGVVSLFTDPLGASFGAITNFDGFIESLGLGSLFGHSSPDDFAKASVLLADNVLPSIESSNSSDMAAAFTKMSKAVNYMELYYSAHRSGSKSRRAITGNQKGVETVAGIKDKLFGKGLKANLKKFGLTYKTVNYTYPKEYLSAYGIDSFNGNHKGSYLEFSKKPSFFSGVGIDMPNLANKENNPMIIWGLLLAVAVVFWKKIKKLF